MLLPVIFVCICAVCKTLQLESKTAQMSALESKLEATEQARHLHCKLLYLQSTLT
jgi:hypothetical protein